MSRRPPLVALAAVCATLLLAPAPAVAHAERESFFPEPPGRVPRYRTSGPYLLVCKGGGTLERIRALSGELEERNLDLYRECRRDGYRHIQAAVDRVERSGTRILVLPGIYREQPWAGAPSGACADLDPNSILTYEQQLACPHVQNLIAILGDGSDDDLECDPPLCRLQIEGTGAVPEDVLIENDFNKLNGLRADRADGIYFRNFALQHAEFNSLYVMETDGFAIDRMLTRWNDEYGFLTFVSDHGLYTDCEAYGNGDSGLYPGSAADTPGDRPSIEIRRCNSHHNLLGYSGTAGNSTYVHDNLFHHNSGGIATDSVASGHPGMPQDSAVFADNRIWANNKDYYKYWKDGTCEKPIEERGYDEGVVCPHFQVPIGVGIILGGGNENLVRGNLIYDNWRHGTMLFGVPAEIRGESDPAKQFDTSHYNKHRANVMGVAPSGDPRPNGVDFWWDMQGTGNCWSGNEGGPDGVESDPATLPECGGPEVPGLLVSPKQAFLLPCAFSDPEDPSTYTGCDFFERPPRPE
jgi:hypothetical protein